MISLHTPLSSLGIVCWSTFGTSVLFGGLDGCAVRLGASMRSEACLGHETGFSRNSTRKHQRQVVMARFIYYAPVPTITDLGLRHGSAGATLIVQYKNTYFLHSIGVDGFLALRVAWMEKEGRLCMFHSF